MNRILSLFKKDHSGIALDYVEMVGEDADGVPLDSSVGTAEGVGKNPPLPKELKSEMLYQDVVTIAWPSMVELGLTQLTTMIDLMMVGRLGAWAITSVGLTHQPRLLLMSLFLSLSVGATSMVAQAKGSGDRERANLYMRQSLLVTMIFSIGIAVLGYLFARPMVRLMGAADEQVLQGGTIYIQVQMLGFVFYALSTLVTACLRGAGNSRTAMVYNVTSNCLKLILNYLLIYGNLGFPALGLAGAGAATALGQFTAFVLATIAIVGGRGYLHLHWKDDFRPHWKTIGGLFKLGLPAMVEQLAMRAGNIMFSRMVAGLGTLAYAAHQICLNTQDLAYMIGQALGLSATSLTGQSLGKRRLDMALLYNRRARRLGLWAAGIFSATVIIFAAPITRLFSDDPQILLICRPILILLALTFPMQIDQVIVSGALRGAGDIRSIALMSLLTALILRPALAWVAINPLGLALIGAWIAFVIDQSARTALTWQRYRSRRWMSFRVG